MSTEGTLRVLLVEDHRDMAETVLDFLESMGIEADYAADGMTGLHLARKNDFDAIVLDLMLPGLDGMSLCKELRERHQVATPIIMMTARDELSDKLEGFESGADDYLIKPFDLPELVARIRSLVRRQQGRISSTVLTVGELTLDAGSRMVTRQNLRVMLTPAGFEILSMLMQHSPNVVSRETLERQLWGENPPASDSFRSQLYKLRKILDKPFDTPMIETVQGAGYRLVPGPPPAPSPQSD
jgi:DNA-binding response OmpR family regulator